VHRTKSRGAGGQRGRRLRTMIPKGRFKVPTRPCRSRWVRRHSRVWETTLRTRNGRIRHLGPANRAGRVLVLDAVSGQKHVKDVDSGSLRGGVKHQVYRHHPGICDKGSRRCIIVRQNYTVRALHFPRWCVSERRMETKSRWKREPGEGR
jgi:hypothetical protein